MVDLSELREQMVVVGSDGDRVGTIDRIEGGSLKLANSEPAAGGTYHRIPAAWVASIDGDQVSLDKTGGAAKSAWEEA